MTRLTRALLAALLGALVLVAGWRVVGQMQAERSARSDPADALRWRSGDPDALQALAERRLAQGDVQGAQALARQLLAREPLRGTAYRVLAAAAEQGGQPAQALALYRIAERRAPRDLATRAWLAQHYLARGDAAQALVQIDRTLRMAPARVEGIAPVLVQLARDRAFADALARSMSADPPWRARVLAALRDPKTGDAVANEQVMEALQGAGGLSADEYARWLDSLIAQERWGEAYARWAGELVQRGQRLPLVYNGDFGQTPSDTGFDWRRRRVPGVLLRFEPVAGSQGSAAYLRFLDRRVPTAGLEQPLMLGPGRYRLHVKARAQSLRSELGLQWIIACAGPGGIVARSDAIDGSFAWRDSVTDFAIPPAGCAGQWLRLVNPVPAGAAQRVTGELWVDDVSIQRVRP